jgi:hypothetical protein
MEQTPYTNFWKEEPANQRKAWRPTDESRRRLQMFGLVQFALLLGILAAGVLIANESKRVPRVFTQLPDGLVFETSQVPAGMSLLARMEMVNDTLSLLYYQEGANNYLGTLKNNVRITILAGAARGMAAARERTNNTVQLNIAETFETGGQITPQSNWFEAMTKATLLRRDKKTEREAAIYLRTHWKMEQSHYILTGIVESSPGEYYEAFLHEKERLHSLKPEELERELNIRKNADIPVSEQNPGKL